MAKIDSRQFFWRKVFKLFFNFGWRRESLTTWFYLTENITPNGVIKLNFIRKAAKFQIGEGGHLIYLKKDDIIKRRP